MYSELRSVQCVRSTQRAGGSGRLRTPAPCPAAAEAGCRSSRAPRCRWSGRARWRARGWARRWPAERHTAEPLAGCTETSIRHTAQERRNTKPEQNHARAVCLAQHLLRPLCIMLVCCVPWFCFSFPFALSKHCTCDPRWCMSTGLGALQRNKLSSTRS